MALFKQNVVIPMAGNGQRFRDVGYQLPKPLIDVNGKPMIQRVVESIRYKDKLKSLVEQEFTFICKQEHIDEYKVDRILEKIEPNCNIIVLDKMTEGSACTVLMASSIINNDDSLLIVNSDQIVTISESTRSIEINHTYFHNYDGFIYLFKDDHPKWSFAKLDEDDRVFEVAEKRVISDNATVGLYGFTKGKYYVWAAEQMIANNIRTNNEFYICPVFNELIGVDKLIRGYFVDKMVGLGTPEDLEFALANKLI